MKYKKKIFPIFLMVLAILFVPLLITSCGSSKQFLAPDYLVTFDRELNDNGYLSDKQQLSSYLIDSTNNQSVYVPVSLEKGNNGIVRQSTSSSKPVQGLVAIWGAITKYVYSATTQLVNYMHIEITKIDSLLDGKLFKKKINANQYEANLEGDFLFAASATFAYGNSANNFSFGIATIRFDIEPYDYVKNSGQQANLLNWTDSLLTSSKINENQKNALVDYTFIKLFRIFNISILYKFYTWGSPVPVSYYEKSTSCLSSNLTSSSTNINIDKAIGVFDAQFVNGADRLYNATSLHVKDSSGKQVSVDGFVLHMQDLLIAVSYSNDFSEVKNDSQIPNEKNNQIKFYSVEILPSPLTPFIFPKVMWENFVKANESSLSKILEPLQAHPIPLDNVLNPVSMSKYGFKINNNKSNNNEEKELPPISVIYNDLNFITNDVQKKFFDKISSNNPASPDTDTGIDAGKYNVSQKATTKVTIKDVFKYFFSNAQDAITPVSDSGFTGELENHFPYFGNIVTESKNEWIR